MVRLSLLTTAVVLAIAAPPASAQDRPQQVTLKNNLLGGHLTQHSITRLTQRTCQRKKYLELLEYRQQADWLQCNIDEARPGSVMLYQLMVDHPAEVVRVLRDKKKLTPTPPAEEFDLPGRSTRLQSATLTPRDAPFQAPLTQPVERALLTALLDLAHWPVAKLDAGHRWQRDLDIPGFAGTQTLEFVDLVKVNNDNAARLTLYLQGRFTGPLEKEYVFDKGQAIIYWSRPERTLLKMEAQAFYRRVREGPPEDSKLKLDVALVRLEMLSAPEQETVKEQLTVFAEALKKQRERADREARDLCRTFISKWPKSMWRPAVDELVEQLTPKKEETKTCSAAELRDALAKAVIAYEAAKTNHEYDLLERSRRALQGLAADCHSQLKKMARDEDPGLRGRAVFALAFGRYPADFALVQEAAQDSSHHVRAMALAGLAARGSPETSAELLLLLLDDEKTAVRRRACEAVAACIPPEHYSTARLIEKLNHLMVYDDSAAVRRQAVLAIAAIGAPADAPLLEKALSYELDPEIREDIHAAIGKLQAKKS